MWLLKILATGVCFPVKKNLYFPPPRPYRFYGPPDFVSQLIQSVTQSERGCDHSSALGSECKKAGGDLIYALASTVRCTDTTCHSCTNKHVQSGRTVSNWLTFISWSSWSLGSFCLQVTLIPWLCRSSTHEGSTASLIRTFLKDTDILCSLPVYRPTVLVLKLCESLGLFE